MGVEIRVISDSLPCSEALGTTANTFSRAVRSPASSSSSERPFNRSITLYASARLPGTLTDRIGVLEVSSTCTSPTAMA